MSYQLQYPGLTIDDFLARASKLPSDATIPNNRVLVSQGNEFVLVDYSSGAITSVQTDGSLSGIGSDVDALRINEGHNFSWSGTHSFSDSVSMTNTLTLNALQGNVVQTSATDKTAGRVALAQYVDTQAVNAIKADAAWNATAWDEAVSWGDHADVGYLTTETDPTVPTHVKNITSGQITNWNTAHSWGDHAAAGYVTVDTAQTITGQKNFTDNVGLGSPDIPESLLHVIADAVGPSDMVQLDHFSGTPDVGTGSVVRFRSADGTKASPVKKADDAALGSLKYFNSDGIGGWTQVGNMQTFAASHSNGEATMYTKFRARNGAGAIADLMTLDGVSGHIGLGTDTPVFSLHAVKQDNSTVILLESFSSVSAGHRGAVVCRKARGTIASPETPISGTGLGSFLVQPFDGDGYNTTGNFGYSAAETYSTTNRGNYFYLEGTDVGTANMREWIRVQNGNLGIGLTNPELPLQIAKKSGIPTALRIQNSGGRNVNFNLTNDTASAGFGIGLSGTGSTDITIEDNGDVTLVTGTGGKVGVGTASPLSLLHLSGDGADDPLLRIDSEGTQIVRLGDSSGANDGVLQLWNPSGNEGVRIRALGSANSFVCANGGDFGIGTSSPTEKLEVIGRIRSDMYYNNTPHSNGSISGSTTINLGNGNIQTAVLTGDATFTFSAPGSCSCQLLMVNSGAGNTITLPGNVKFVSGAQPEDDGVEYVLSIVYDGSSYWVSWTT